MKTLLKIAALADIWLILWGWIDEDWSLMALAGVVSSASSGTSPNADAMKNACARIGSAWPMSGASA